MVIVMKKKIITIIIIFLEIAIVALFFIPWYDNYYYLPGVNSETGEEVITRFDEWQSPFYALVIKGGNSHPTYKPLSRSLCISCTGVCILRRAICSIIGTVYYQ